MGPRANLDALEKAEKHFAPAWILTPIPCSIRPSASHYIHWAIQTLRLKRDFMSKVFEGFVLLEPFHRINLHTALGLNPQSRTQIEPSAGRGDA